MTYQAPYPSERSIALWRRWCGGETQTALAKEFGISTTRARQICLNIDGRVRRALRRLEPNAAPYLYDVWFEERLDDPKIRIRPY